MSSRNAEVEQPKPRTVVHKFGGTSVADAERYRHVAQLLLARDEDVQVTVVSAMKGVTDALIALARLAAAGVDRDTHVDDEGPMPDMRSERPLKAPSTCHLAAATASASGPASSRSSTQNRM